jgi:hypothetical protein
VNSGTDTHPHTSRHTCGMRANGTAACWGSNGSGESIPPAGFG